MSAELYGKCPAEVDLCLPQGQTWKQKLIFESPAGTPVDLTNYSATWKLRTSAEAASATVSLSSVAGTLTLNSNGEIAMNYSAISSSAITAATYLHSLKLTNPSGDVRRLAEGVAVVSRDTGR